MTPDQFTIIDGDGHVIEDKAAITALMPEPYRKWIGHNPWYDLFVAGDHLHYANLFDLQEGAFDMSVGPEKWEKFMTATRIQKSVLYATGGLFGGYILSADWAIDLCRAYNDWLYETYLKRSPRFQGMALIPLQEPAAAVEELRRAVKELGMLGACLPSTGIQSHLGHPRYWPIYEEADRLGCAIAVHGGAHANLGLDDLSPYAPVHALGHPFGQMISFGSLIFNGVLDKFPRARFAFLEAGISWLMVCLEQFDRSHSTHVQHDPRKRFLQLRPKEKVKDYIMRHIDEGRIFIGCEGEEPDIAYAISLVGNKPFLFSSDFPHEVNTEACQHEIEEIAGHDKLTRADKEAILCNNSRRLYNFQ